MSSIIKVNEIQDGGGNTIVSSNGSGTFTSNLPNTGITMAQQWRLTASTNSGSNSDVTSNWEKNDSSGYASIGSDMTESSGVFSFPSTGVYYLSYTFSITSAANDTACGLLLYYTSDNSAYSIVADARDGGTTSGANIGGSSSFMFNVTDTSNQKFKFATTSFSSGTYLIGSSTSNKTHFTIMRLGDSV